MFLIKRSLIFSFVVNCRITCKKKRGVGVSGNRTIRTPRTPRTVRFLRLSLLVQLKLLEPFPHSSF
jgi:hypothetical protein